MKLNCIVDTCSCIYLSHAEYHQKTLLKHLSDATNLNYSHEVHREIIDHRSKGLPAFITDAKYMVNTRKYSITKYQQKMLGKTLTSRKPGGSRGEVDNFLLSLDLLHHIKKGAIIYITDDKKAMNGVIGEWLPAFPGIQFWSSYDVLLFLYAHHVIPSKEIAFELLRDLNSVARVQEGVSEELNSKLQKLLTEMNKKFEKVSRIFS